MQPITIAAEPSVLRSRDLAGLTMTECAYPPGLRMAKHSHELPYLSFVLRGTYTETIGRSEFAAKPAVLIAHPPLQAHAVAFHRQEVRIFRTEIKARWLERLSGGMEAFKSPACFGGGTAVHLAFRLYREFCSPDKYSPLAVEGILLEMLAEVSRREGRPRAGRVPPWLERARELLQGRSADVPTLGELAVEVGVHPVYLAREFRKFFGASVGEYVRRRRLEAACRELAESDLPLSEVAGNAGFYDQSHFCNSFKRHTGLTPAAFRSVTRTP